MDDFIIYFCYFQLGVIVFLYTYSFFYLEKANVFLLSYFYFSFITQFSMELLYHLHRNNLLVMNFFLVGQMILLGLFYRSLFKNKKQKQLVKIGLSLSIVALIIQLCLDSSQLFKFNVLEIVITFFSIVFFALMHLYNMLTGEKKYYFFTLGVILYLLPSAIIFIAGNLSIKLSDNAKYIMWALNGLLTIVYYFFILYEWKVSFAKKPAELN